MSLFLFETVPAEATRDAAQGIITAIGETAREHGGAVLESQVTTGNARIFTIVEFDGGDAGALSAGIRERLGDAAREIDGPHEVRLVGAELEDIRALPRPAGYLVEWDIPAEIDMETYLNRKRANSPKYAEVPEVSFLRTYVREDTVKCLCFYEAEDERDVLRAREAVSAPVDRLHQLDAQAS